MADYGGMGGIKGGRALNRDDKFEEAVDRALGAKMSADSKLCEEVWCALANVDWVHVNGDTASYSWRAAGDLVAAVIRSGDYMDWYCSDCDPGHVTDEIAEALAAEGWKPNTGSEDIQALAEAGE